MDIRSSNLPRHQIPPKRIQSHSDCYGTSKKYHTSVLLGRQRNTRCPVYRGSSELRPVKGPVVCWNLVKRLMSSLAVGLYWPGSAQFSAELMISSLKDIFGFSFQPPKTHEGSTSHQEPPQRCTTSPRLVSISTARRGDRYRQPWLRLRRATQCGRALRDHGNSSARPNPAAR